MEDCLVQNMFLSVGSIFCVCLQDRLVFHCGWRRFAACPVFSQHSSGNKHKAQDPVILFRHTNFKLLSLFYRCFESRRSGSIRFFAFLPFLLKNYKQKY